MVEKAPPGEALVLNAGLLRALAHPIRTQLLSALRRRGPATATTLAQQLGTDTGTTSYHLRQLAAHGLIVEDETQGNQRDRWWKAAHQRTVFNDLAAAAAEPEFTASYLHNIAQLNMADLLKYLDAAPTQPKAWQKAAGMNDTALELTPAELTRLMKEIDTLVERYRAQHQPGKRGSRTVAVQYNGFPRLP